MLLKVPLWKEEELTAALTDRDDEVFTAFHFIQYILL